MILLIRAGDWNLEDAVYLTFRSWLPGPTAGEVFPWIDRPDQDAFRVVAWIREQQTREVPPVVITQMLVKYHGEKPGREYAEFAGL